MSLRTVLPLGLLLLSGCATHSGVYTPDCIAFAGDRIELDDGRFTWDKFTDQLEVSEEGERIDPFPDYPVRGRYLLDGEKVTFIAETDVSLPDLYLVEHDRQRYLLSAAQYQAWQRTDTLANCPLIQNGHP